MTIMSSGGVAGQGYLGNVRLDLLYEFLHIMRNLT